MSAIAEGDLVTIFGATGGVGYLVANKLVDSGYKVRALVRDVPKAKAMFGDRPVEFVEGNFVSGAGVDRAIEGAAAIVCCTGTTAFPTAKWAGGNTPVNVDKAAVERLAARCAAPGGAPALKRFALLTSVGVERTGQMPFALLNAFGVLDCKRAAEAAVVAAAAAARAAGPGPRWDHLVLRPGRLVGAPFSNADVAAALALTQPADRRGVRLAPGDALAGDLERADAAEALVRGLMEEAAGGKTLCLVNAPGPAPGAAFWAEAFAGLP